MIKILLKKWMEKLTAPSKISSVTLPFTPPCNGLLIVLMRASTQGRIYETYSNTTPTIADGYNGAGAYTGPIVFVEKGKQVSVSANYNVSSVAYYFIPLVGGVLRNLSNFKAFRLFMPLQKGGGVDASGQEIDSQNSNRCTSKSFYNGNDNSKWGITGSDYAPIKAFIWSVQRGVTYYDDLQKRCIVSDDNERIERKHIYGICKSGRDDKCVDDRIGSSSGRRWAA